MSTTTNLTELRGNCYAPFLQEDKFPTEGGYLTGRFCASVDSINGTSCCLPCPASDWTYSDNFRSNSEIANWINVVGFCFCLFLLLSYAFLPPKWTNRHYLSVCTTISVLFMSLAFMIPLGTSPDMCYNEITPNDMESNGTCAVTGAFLLFGAWSVVVWVFMRALSLHIQICWEVTLGNKFLWHSLVLGWGIPVVALALVLSLTGVSYRFGTVCHVNHKLALQDFWGPLLVFAALAMVLQFITMGYCIHVFLRGFSDGSTTTNSTGRPATASGSIKTASAKETYRRVKQVVKLQWRGAAVVLVVIAEVAFFSAVFVSMDNSSQVNTKMVTDSLPWLVCLVEHPDDKEECLHLVGNIVQPASVVLTVLIFLSLTGFWCLLFFGRWSMILGWADFFKRNCIKHHEFVSADARRFSGDPSTYEMLNATPHQLNINMANNVYAQPRSAVPNFTAYSSPDLDAKRDSDFGPAPTRVYVSPVASYSVPRPPSAFGGGGSTDWAHKSPGAGRSPSPPAAVHHQAKQS